MTATLQAQDAKRPIVLSHDKIDGPLAGAYRIEDLQVFADGTLVYVEESAAKQQSGKPLKSAYKFRVGSEEVRQLTELLENSEIRSLPATVPSVIAPIDFFWLKSLTIARADSIQEITIENFYPFVNMHQAVYPRALIELECNLRRLKAAAAKRSKEESAWCDALTASGGKTGISAATSAGCQQDSTRPEIVAGEGWRPVRIGATSKAVDAFLGEGQRGNRYSDVYFKEYASKGIEVSYDNSTDTVHAIFFYNGQHDREQIGLFCGQTAKGIGWRSSVEDVKHAYGKPVAEFSGIDWVRLVFIGIDFRFENGKMVRIGIPGT